jgi:predicted nucleotidyltransferase
MNDTDDSIVEKFRSLLLKRIRVDKIILFGSRAGGDAQRDSDNALTWS